MSTWYDMLYESRARLGLSQAELAARSHVSLPSVKSYEQGKRHPSRPYLIAMLEALRIERSRRNAILSAAGYATDGLEIGPWQMEGFMYTPQAAAEHIESYAWPSFVANEFLEVSAANRVAQAIWNVDIKQEFPDDMARNLVGLASDPRFIERVENRDEAFRIIASIFKGHPRGPEALDRPSPYFAAVLERFRAGDKAYVELFAKAWQEAEALPPKVRWAYPLSWRDPEFGLLTFTGLVSIASEPDGLVFNDWIPSDAETWDGLERLKAERLPGPSTAA